MTRIDTQRIDGKAAAAALSAETAAKVTEWTASGHRRPALAVVLVGEDPASQVYVRNKQRQTEAVGMRSIGHHLPADIDQAALLHLVAELNADPEVDGILVQLPLPRHIDANKVIGRHGPEQARFCEGCHAPGELLSGRTNRFASVPPQDALTEGISCISCHTATHADPIIGADRIVVSGSAGGVA